VKAPAAKTVVAYLKGLAPERRAALSAVREVILDHLDGDFEEGLQYGMIGYYVPHRVYPKGYHCNPKEPLPFAALGAQKSHNALHLMAVYGSKELDAWFRGEWAKSGKKLDMGKACLRFESADDVDLKTVGKLFARVPAKKYVQTVEAQLAGRATGKKAAAKR
jgi:hypothetical protein